MGLFLILVLSSGNLAAGPTTGSNEWGRIEISYELTGENPTINFEEEADQCSIDFKIDGVERTLLLKDDAIIFAGEQYDTSSYHNLRLNGARDFFFVELDVKTSSSSSSSSSSSKSDSSNSSQSSSSSYSSSSESSVDEHVKSFGFVNWNDKEIIIQLKGGNSISSDLELKPEQCLFEFNLDRGKHKRTIAIKENSLEIDGVQKEMGGDFSKLSVTATQKKDSLLVEADGKEIWGHQD